MSSISHLPFLLSELIYSGYAELKENSRLTSQDYIFVMSDSFKDAISCNVFRLTRTKHSEKRLWSLPVLRMFPWVLNIMEMGVYWRWPALCHDEGLGWIGLVQGLCRTDIWIHWVPDRGRKLSKYKRSDHLLKRRANLPRTLVVVILVWFRTIGCVFNAFFTFESYHFLQSQTVLEPQRTAVVF